MFLLCGAPARAQLAGSVSLDNDYRLRGYSLSGRRPAASLDLAFDHISGLYVNGSTAAVFNGDDEVRLLAVEGGAGYAQRVGANLSLDVGVTRSQYRLGYQTTQAAHYSEVYTGLTGSRASAYVYYSPDWLRPGVRTLYGEANVLIATVHKIKITGHVGLLQTLAKPSGIIGKTEYDWRLGAARQFGHLEVHTALTGGGPGHEFYSGGTKSLNTVTFGVSWFPGG